MFLELPPDLVTLLTGMQTTINEMKTELSAIHSQLQAKPPGPDVPRREYSVEEIAEILGKRPYTVREWCRHGQINATKRAERRGAAALWSISSDELTRYKNEGLLPIFPDRNNRN